MSDVEVLDIHECAGLVATCGTIILPEEIEETLKYFMLQATSKMIRDGWPEEFVRAHVFDYRKSKGMNITLESWRVGDEEPADMIVFQTRHPMTGELHDYNMGIHEAKLSLYMRHDDQMEDRVMKYADAFCEDMANVLGGQWNKTIARNQRLDFSCGLAEIPLYKKAGSKKVEV